MEEEIRSAVEETGTDSTSAENAEATEPGANWAKEKAEFEDLLRRRQAEFENFRRRMERERIDFAEYSGMEIVKALLPIVDDFERALKASSGFRKRRICKRCGVDLQASAGDLNKTGS